jgi:hypothetical protein
VACHAFRPNFQISKSHRFNSAGIRQATRRPPDWQFRQPILKRKEIDMKKDITDVAPPEGGCPLEEKNLSRRELLRGAMAVGFGMLVPGALLSSRSAAGAEPSVVATTKKLTQISVKYQQQPKGDQKCATCVQFVPPNACNLVEGNINPEGWCVLWAKKK